MPIRINILAESLAEEELRRRDPVKRATYIGVFLVILTLAWWSSMWAEQVVSKGKLARIEAEINSYTNSYQSIQTGKKAYEETKKRLDALQQLSNARFLQGNLLNAMQTIYTPNVQVIRLNLEQTYTITAGGIAKTNNPGPNQSIIPGKPPTSTEKILLTIDAKDSSINQGEQINRFKEAIAKSDFFQSMLIPTNAINLVRVIPQQSTLNSKPSTMFSLECRFLDKTR